MHPETKHQALYDHCFGGSFGLGFFFGGGLSRHQSVSGSRSDSRVYQFCPFLSCVFPISLFLDPP